MNFSHPDLIFIKGNFQDPVQSILLEKFTKKKNLTNIPSANFVDNLEAAQNPQLIGHSLEEQSHSWDY